MRNVPSGFGTRKQGELHSLWLGSRKSLSSNIELLWEFVVLQRSFCMYVVSQAVCSKAVVVLLLTFCLLFLPLLESVNVLCFVVSYFMSILVLQSSWWGRESWLLCLNLPSRCLVMVERLFLTVPRGCLRFVIVVFPDHTHLLFLNHQ